MDGGVWGDDDDDDDARTPTKSSITEIKLVFFFMV